MAKETKKMNPKKLRIVLGATLGVLILVIGGLALYGSLARATVLPGVSVGKTSLGNDTREQAATDLTAALKDHQVVHLVIDGKTFELNTTDSGLHFDAEKTADAALALGNSGNPLVAAYYRLRSVFWPIDIAGVVTIDQTIYDSALDKLLSASTTPARDASLQFVGGDWQVVPAQTGNTIPHDVIAADVLRAAEHLQDNPVSLSTATVAPAITTQIAEAMIDAARQGASEGITLKTSDKTIQIDTATLTSWIELSSKTNPDGSNLSLNADKLTAYVQDLAKQFNQDPANAELGIQDDKVVATKASVTGRTLDEDATKSLILAAFLNPLSRTVTLPFATKDPDIDSTQLDKLGLKELIGSATTNFAGSPTNRVHNIQTGANYLNGELVKPGDEFSTIKSLGAIDASTGYLPELVIKGNKTLPEYGGGLCQVSTTLFRSVLNAGLKVTERVNHSYRVSYYEAGVGPGLDATIYDPQPDFKFLNDTPGWIYVQTSVNVPKNTITFSLFGTKDGRTSTISKPSVTNVKDPPAPAYVESDSLPSGTIQRIESAHPGATADVSYTVMRDGKVLYQQNFHSVYQPWQAKYLYGPGTTVPGSTPAPTATQTATPSPTPSPSDTATPTPSATDTVTTPPNSSAD